ncbi:glycosyltransferase family 2 protein [Pseudomonas syringae]|nr:glycosyltransferase family 2 protein [Pseudomonas syringae]
MNTSVECKKPNVACCAIMKNEGPYLVEWVAYYTALGFEKIYIYENDSTDDTPEILKQLHACGAIEYIPWPSLDKKSPQLSAYEDAISRTKSDWILFCDTDEFLVLKKHSCVTDFIRDFGIDVSCISINWRIFGSSGNEKKTLGLVTERFSKCSAEKFVSNHHVKSFVRPKDVKEMHIHAPETNGKSVYPDGTLLSFKDDRRGLSSEIKIDTAVINHYFTKTREEWTIKKARGNANRALDAKDKFERYQFEVYDSYDRNEEIDTSISKHMQKTKEIIKELEGLKG